jgi:hypothetical protein
LGGQLAGLLLAALLLLLLVVVVVLLLWQGRKADLLLQTRLRRG